MTEFIRDVETGSGLGSSPGVVLLTRDLFDAIEFDATCTGDHRAAAQRMTDLAATGTQTDAFPRAEAFVRAGEEWLLADDAAAAAAMVAVPLLSAPPTQPQPSACRTCPTVTGPSCSSCCACGTASAMISACPRTATICCSTG